ncbi:Wzz/FepE/Etk N-terminal domain-containing protein [Staphylococcus sp. HKU1]|uniref:Wzz/FepE/Etk N-terminal domain-containing protein n=1 Tax=unclassified Staphylococcus TaxID=91994 RepID=UPI00203D16CC|nr:Wzz/FepE/Etk N-terminal domain-containing protein [Staphylococcus sp. Marseille-Q6910]
MESTVDLTKILKMLKNNLKLLIILPLIFLLISAIISFFFIDNKYQATTQVLVNEKEKDPKMMAQEVQSNIQLVNTYSEIIKSPRILEKVSKELDGEYLSSEINSMLKVSNQEQSQILEIAVVSKNKEKSEQIANKVAKVFSDEVPKIMNVDNVSILSKANDTASQVEPKILLNLPLSFILGLFLALIIIFSKELLDKRIKNEEDVENVLGLPVLGSIQKYK